MNNDINNDIKTRQGTFSQKAFSILQRVGQSLMLPVSVLPAAGLLVAVGRMLQNAAQAEGGVIVYPIINSIGSVFFTGGLAIFEQLPAVFAVGVAIGFTGGAGVAGLAAVVGYFTMLNVIGTMVDLRGLDLKVNTGVFGGILMGLISARLYHSFYQTKLHPIFGFFAGKRLVPIITAGSAIVVGMALAFVWPPIQNQINAFGEMVMGSDFGPAFYAAGKRLLIPVGLHHVYYPPFLFEFGDFVTEAGKVLHGESPRYFAGDPTAGRFMASEFPIMLFGLPAATLAMYMRAKTERKKAVAGMMISAALTSIITGITEPIEFMFIFVAPLLYLLHVALAFGSGLLTGFFDVHLGYTFSASLIDFGLGFFNQNNSFYLFLVIGPIIALAYFGGFYGLIGLMNFKTPGREEDESATEKDFFESAGASSTDSRYRKILIAIGGAENVAQLDACITRLRLGLFDGTLVNENALKSLGAAGTMNAGGGNVQVVFGPESDSIKEEIQKLITSDKANLANGVQKAPRTVLIRTPIQGKLVKLSDVPDQTFAQKILGDGIAIDPSEGVVRSPVDGEIASLFRTGHAIGVRADRGLDILIHIGLDTVEMNGAGFEPLVKEGDRVKQGQPLIRFDSDAIRKAGKSTISPIVFTDKAQFTGLKVLLNDGNIDKNTDLFEVTF